MSRSIEHPVPHHRSTRQLLLVVVLVLFGGFTAAALAVDGIVGIFHAITFNLVSIQIFVDLVLDVGLIDVWVYGDARSRGRNPWPWLVASLATGMFSPLIYLLVRSRVD